MRREYEHFKKLTFLCEVFCGIFKLKQTISRVAIVVFPSEEQENNSARIIFQAELVDNSSLLEREREREGESNDLYTPDFSDHNSRQSNDLTQSPVKNEDLYLLDIGLEMGKGSNNSDNAPSKNRDASSI
ncbi:hypothetical protein EAE96_010238 [Botrytis aclada]|nr:hypothetical protein EAE96_010238 [Botrytis aclada]